MKLFVSYSRSDQAAVRQLVAGLENSQHSIWSDARLHGGQAWWSEILEQIEQADAVIVALSPELLHSTACAREWRYALALGKAVLPFAVAPVNPATMPGELAEIHHSGSFADLSAALHMVTPLPPPEPLPPRPPPPISEFALMRDRICQRQLEIAEQFAIVGELLLLSRSDSPAAQEAAHQLIVDVRKSRYINAGPARLLDETAVATRRPTTARWAIIGAALGGVGLASLFFLVKVYGLVPKPYDVFVPNIVMIATGVILCLIELPRHRGSARLGLTICALSAVVTTLDLLKNGLHRF